MKLGYTCLLLQEEAHFLLSEEVHNTLDVPIAVKEVQVAVAALQSAKTPGPDGLPAEFYKTNSELLVPKFHYLLLTMMEEACLPPSMLEVVIVVIPKPNKDPTQCPSYGPISLLKNSGLCCKFNGLSELFIPLLMQVLFIKSIGKRLVHD